MKHFPSRTTCRTITVFEKDDKLRSELEVQAIRQNDGSELWAIFIPGGGAWTRDRNGFVPRSTISLFERRQRALWTEAEALAEVQVAAAYKLKESARRIAALDREHATPSSLYLIADTTETAQNGQTLWRCGDDGTGLTTQISAAARFTVDQLPKEGDPSGFGVLLATAQTLGWDLEIDQDLLAAAGYQSTAAIYFILDTTEPVTLADTMISWRKLEGGVTTYLSEAGRFTAAQIPERTDASGFEVRCATAEKFARNGQVSDTMTASLIIDGDES